MNANGLLTHYDKIADAPDAIPKLRRFILDLAVRGKLVPQDGADEPASELLKRIEVEKAGLLKTNPTSATQTVPTLSVAPHWHLVALADVLLEMQTGPFGSSLHQSDYRVGGTPVINPASLQNEKIVPIEKMAVADTTLSQLASFKLQMGDVVMARRGEMGRCAAVTEREVGWLCGTGSLILRPSKLIAINYLVLFIGSPTSRKYLGGTAVGTTMMNLNQSILLRMPFGLPPLAEQHRIVAKVDELMGFCDQLEATRAEREVCRNRLVAATFAHLNTPDDPQTFQTRAQAALKTLPALTTRPNQIKTLRQTILNLAVRGKLVPQDAGDEPADELLKRVAIEKTRLVKAGVVPQKKDPIRDSYWMMEHCPPSWVQIALGEVCDLVTSGSRGWAEFYAKSGPGFVRAQNIRFGKLRLDDLAFVNPPSRSEGSRTQVAKGDLLIVITGAGVTNPALLDHDLGEAYVSQHVGLVRPSDKRLSEWLLLSLMADSGGRAELLERAYGAGKPGLNLDNIRSLCIPLPPLAEQHRIVAKVDELMALCDQLEATLTTTTKTRTRLLAALLAQALVRDGHNDTVRASVG